MRAFIAVDTSREVVREIEALVGELKDQMHGAHWVGPENLHLTLRFLGETDEKRIAVLSDALAVVARRYRSFSLEFRGIGFFPSARRPRVLWVGIVDAPEVLAKLQGDVESEVQRFGFEPERRRFSPHLTIARFRRPPSDSRPEELGRRFAGHPFGASPVQEVVLYRSILKPSGAEYHALGRFTLQPSSGGG